MESIVSASINSAIIKWNKDFIIEGLYFKGMYIIYWIYVQCLYNIHFFYLQVDLWQPMNKTKYGSSFRICISVFLLYINLLFLYFCYINLVFLLWLFGVHETARPDWSTSRGSWKRETCKCVFAFVLHLFSPPCLCLMRGNLSPNVFLIFVVLSFSLFLSPSLSFRS